MQNRLRELRLNASLSQEQVARDVGISIRSLSRYEQGTADPCLEMACRLCAYYHKSVEYVFYNNDSMQINS